MTKPEAEAKAREIVETAIKDHDAGGYAFAGLNETLILRITQALIEQERPRAEVKLPDDKWFEAVAERLKDYSAHDAVLCTHGLLKCFMRNQPPSPVETGLVSDEEIRKYCIEYDASEKEWIPDNCRFSIMLRDFTAGFKRALAQPQSPGARAGVSELEIEVDQEGISFGPNCWISHSAIVENRGPLVSGKYQKWIKARLSSPPPASSLKGVRDEIDFMGIKIIADPTLGPSDHDWIMIKTESKHDKVVLKNYHDEVNRILHWLRSKLLDSQEGK